MKYEEIINELKTNQEITGTGAVQLYQAISQVYPMILLANLTKNTYVMLNDVGFLYKKLISYGNYDEMISDGLEAIHPTYRETFLDAFERANLMRRYARGITTVEARLYQKGTDGEYKWVNTKVIRLSDESGDVVQVCLNSYIDN